MSKEIANEDFEVWFDDILMETADKNQKLPPPCEEKECRLNERLEKTFNNFFWQEKF